MNEVENECNVCTNNFTKTVKKVMCSCEYNCCIVCAKKYLLSKDELQPKCMNCENEWDRMFLIANFGKTFVNTKYKQHREDVLFNLELKMMPATQPYLEKEIKMRELNNKLFDIKNKKDKLYNNILSVTRDEYSKMDLLIEEIKKETAKIVNIKRKTYDNELILIQEQEQLITNELMEIIDKEFNMPTNVKCETCNCYLNENNVCIICKTEVCNKCYEKKIKDHICDETILKNITYLNSEPKIKNCPSCNIVINQYEGCDDAFCVYCKTKFNWKTLKIMKGTSTNDTYRRYIRSINITDKVETVKEKNISHDICPSELDDLYEQILSYRILELKKHKIRSNSHISSYLDTTVREKIVPYLISIREVINVEINKFDIETNAFNRSLKLRISYMSKRISKETFKSEIQKLDKDALKKRDIQDILTLYANCGCDILNGFLNEFLKEKDDYENYISLVSSTCNKMQFLIEITNNSFKLLSNNFNCKTFRIDTNRFFFE